MRKASIKKFSDCEAGNISVIFAFASLVVLGLIGLAIDTSEAHNVRSDLQDACDTVALAESISIYNGGELDNKAARLLMVENFSMKSNNLSLEMQDSNGEVTCNASYLKETFFGSILGSDKLKMSVVSTAVANTNTGSINLAIDLTNISSDARHWNQLYVYTYQDDFDVITLDDFDVNILDDFDVNTLDDFDVNTLDDFDVNTLGNRTLLVENKTGVSNDRGDQDYIDQQTQNPISISIPAGHKFGFELSSTDSSGIQNRFFSDQSPQNLEIVNSDCFSSIAHSWEDRIDGDDDFNDLEYTVSCEYQGGETTLSVTSRLTR